MNMSLAVTVLVTGVIKPLLILLLLLVISLLIRKKSASLQHFVLTIGLIGILLLPFIGLLMPSISWHVLPTFDIMNGETMMKLNDIYNFLIANITKFELMIIFGGYTLFASWILFYFLLGVIGLHQQTQSSSVIKDPEFNKLLVDLSEILDIQRTVTLVASKDIDSPQMWGFLRPVIMLPRAALLWDSDKKLAVMMHELGHVRRYDWLITIIVKITCAIFWFLPPVWWCGHKIYQQAEIASDDFIYYLRDKHIRYAETLLAIAGGDRYGMQEDKSSLGILGRSALYERIVAVLDRQRSHQSVAMETAQYWVLLGGFFLVLMASIQFLPLKKVFLNANSGVLIIQMPEESINKNSEISAPLVKDFDWVELKHIRSNLSERPPSIESIESLRVQVSSDQELSFPKTTLSKEDISFTKPDIQVQGYLPLDMVVPEYPTSALHKGIEGWVVVSFTIGINGEVIDPRIIEQHPSNIFSQVTLKAIKQSRYRPQLFDGQPAVIQGVVEKFTFKLQKNTSSNRRR